MVVKIKKHKTNPPIVGHIKSNYQNTKNQTGMSVLEIKKMSSSHTFHHKSTSNFHIIIIRPHQRPLSAANTQSAVCNLNQF